jgi:hypothetical protein
MKKTVLILSILTCNPFLGNMFASPLCGGDIAYSHVSGLTFNFTTAVRVCEPADSLHIAIYFGDGSVEQLSAAVETISEGVHIATFTAQHTYPSASAYIVSVEEPNLPAGVCNVPNSVDVPLSLTTTLSISPFFGSNATPLLSPIYEIYVEDGHVVHDLQAIDPDGDSLSYTLLDGFLIPGLEVTSEGMLKYLPTQVCEVLAEVSITEWRDGNAFPSVVRTLILDGTSVSVGEIVEDIVVSAYPNPTSGPLSITSAKPLLTVAVVDMLGRVLLAERGESSNSKAIDLTHLPAGIYVVRVETEAGSWSQRVVRE